MQPLHVSQKFDIDVNFSNEAFCFSLTPGNKIPVAEIKTWSKSILDWLCHLLSSPQRSRNGIHNSRRISENSECKESLWVLC